jgi:hypothetical protein
METNVFLYHISVYFQTPLPNFDSAYLSVGRGGSILDFNGIMK